jgi:hypothetical protein
MHQTPHSWGFLFVGCWVDLRILDHEISKGINQKLYP